MRVGFLCGIMAFVAVACGSDYGEEGSGTGGGTSTSSSSSSGDSGTSTASSGLGATPGTVECGRTKCDLATQICCATSATDQTCQDKGKACDGAGFCDDAADCKKGQKCCGSPSGFSSSSTTCVDTCGGLIEAQVCRTNEECGAQDCIHQSCYGIASYLCGLNPFCQKL